MKLSFLLFLCVVITSNLCAQGVTKYGESTITSTNFVDLNGKIGSVVLLDKYGKIFPCGSTLTITHTVGTVAPANSTINYGTVPTSLSGATKCWITQNLGASTQATSATDATDATAGWYWQFNLKQGYATGPTPAWTMPAVTGASDWLPANDPCTIELGAGWRIPTHVEWAAVDANGGWTTYTNAYTSVLKLHAAGVLAPSGGVLANRGTGGYYWSSTQNSVTSSWYLNFSSSTSATFSVNKADGMSLRCLRD